MAAIFKLRQLLANTETTYGENSESGSPSLSVLVPALDGSITMTLTDALVPDSAAQSRLAVKAPGHPGIKEVLLEYETDWSGVPDGGAGSVAQSVFTTMLGNELGDGAGAGTAGTTISGTASTANVLGVADATTVSAGGIIRVGVKGDGRGDGQAVAIFATDAGPAPDTITLLTNCPAAPTTSGDVVYACINNYHVENAALSSYRFLGLYSTATHQYLMTGMMLDGLEFTIPIGSNALPKIKWRWKGCYWRALTTSFPDTTAIPYHDCAPVAGGSVFINDFGTATRATITPSQIDLTIDMHLSPIIGPPNTSGGSRQNVTGYVRSAFDVGVRCRIPASQAYSSWWATSGASLTYKHLLFCANPTNKRSVGFYLPRILPSGQDPTQPVAENEQNYVDVFATATESSTTATNLTRASLVLFAG